MDDGRYGSGYTGDVGDQNSINQNSLSEDDYEPSLDLDPHDDDEEGRGEEEDWRTRRPLSLEATPPWLKTTLLSYLNLSFFCLQDGTILTLEEAKISSLAIMDLAGRNNVPNFTVEPVEVWTDPPAHSIAKIIMVFITSDKLQI